MIKRVQLSNFLAVTDGALELGPRVTLLVGANGSGKTTRLEALIWGLWGQRLRPGALPPGATVIVEESQSVIERTVTGSGERVRFGEGDWQQKTKILPDLEARFGTHESWSRSLHITGRSVGAFSAGSASYRWDHLVRLTGASRYDKAIERANSDLTVAGTASDKARSLHRAAGYDLENAGHDYRRQIARLREVPVVDARALESSRLREAQVLTDIKAGQSSRSAHSDGLRVQNDQILRSRAEVESLRERISAEIERTVPCGECGAPRESPELVGLQQELATLTTAEHELREGAMSTRHKLLNIDQKISELQIKASVLRESIIRGERSEEILLQEERRSLDMFLLCIKSQRMYQSLSISLASAQSDEAEARNVRDTLKESKLLYLRGFLREINARTSEYLDLIGARARVRLSQSGENKLELLTDGTGAENYAQCSGGEQRRIDLCLSLAMSAVASQIGNLTHRAPLVVDEAFDTLDEQGMEALLSLACHIAKDRQVILVSHVLPDLPLSPDVFPTRLGP